MDSRARAPAGTAAVLIVERDTEFAAALARAFEGVGLSTRCVADGDLAVEETLWACPRLIVLDLDVPAVSGRQMLEVLREQPVTQSVALLALATFSYHQAAEAIAAGADDCLIKPLPPDEVAVAARDLLQRVDRWNATIRRVTTPSHGRH